MTDSKVFLKKYFKFLDDAHLLLVPISSTKAIHGRHDFVNIRTDGFYFSVAEGAIKEFARLLGLQTFFSDDLF